MHRCYLYVNNYVAFCFSHLFPNFVQIQAGKVTHILLSDTLHCTACAQSMQSIFSPLLTNANAEATWITEAGDRAVAFLLAQQAGDSTAAQFCSSKTKGTDVIAHFQEL